MYEHIDAFPGDPILGLNEIFSQDTRPDKINLSIGYYYNDAGQLPVIEAVGRAEQKIIQAATHPYLPIEGDALYRRGILRLIFPPDSHSPPHEHLAIVQSLGGSGALKIGADFLKRFFPASQLWLSDPSWENHRAIFEGSGIRVNTYPYYNADTGLLNFEGMITALQALPEKSIVLLHPCCHNPTGVDLTQTQWETVITVAEQKQLIPFLDMAYMGFAQGMAEDAWPVRRFAASGLPILVSCSFSKNAAMYGERCGALIVACHNQAEAGNVLTQLKAAVRRIYSSPSAYGAKVIAALLSDPRLTAQWFDEVTQMRLRLHSVREQLRDRLSACLPDRDFSYLTTQQGLFSYTGLTPAQAQTLRREYAVYILDSGRMCVAGLNSGNIVRVAEAMAAVLQKNG